MLDGFNWHYQASVDCSKQCRDLISPTSREKQFGTPRIKLRAARQEARMLPLCYADNSIPTPLFNCKTWLMKPFLKVNHVARRFKNLQARQLQ